MAEVTVNLIEGEELVENEDGLLEPSQTAIVTGVTSGTPAGMLFAALTTPGVPRWGEAHPVVNGTHVYTRIAKPAGPSSPNKVEIIIKYRVPRPGTPEETPNQGQPSVIRVGSAIQYVDSQKDLDGNQIVVEHNDVKQGGTVSVPVPSPVLALQRRELGPTTRIVALVARFTGALNASAIWGFGPAMVMCTEAAGISVDNGVTFTMDYSFAVGEPLPPPFGPDGWTSFDPVAAFIDPETGAPPPDLVDYEGLVPVKTIKREDFGDLNIA